MDKILLLLTLPGFGRKNVKNFINSHPLLLKDDDYFYYMIKSIIDSPLYPYLDKVKEIRDTCHTLGVEIVMNENKNIVDSPLILFSKGNYSILLENIIAVVGTRKPSSLGMFIGERAVKTFAYSGLAIASGLAIGCDTLAHKATINYGGKTIAVLPYGYRPEVAPWILEKGLIISEYPPYSSGKKYKFIERNRIITGISKGLYVIETNGTGGSVHSLKYALKQGLPIGYGLGFKGIEKYKATQCAEVLNLKKFVQDNYR